jgi:hypothetical protein
MQSARKAPDNGYRCSRQTCHTGQTETVIEFPNYRGSSPLIGINLPRGVTNPLEALTQMQQSPIQALGFGIICQPGHDELPFRGRDLPIQVSTQ